MRPGPARRTPQNFLPLLHSAVRAAVAAAPKLRGRPATARERGRPPSRGCGGARGWGSGGPSAPPGARCPHGVPESRGPAGQVIGGDRGADRQSCYCLRFPRVPAQRGGDGGRRHPGRGAATGCAAGAVTERGGRTGRLLKKHTTERKKRKKEVGGKGRCLVPPRCAPAPCTSRLGRRRSCGDLWKERERRGNSPGRPSSLPRSRLTTGPRTLGARPASVLLDQPAQGRGTAGTSLWWGTATPRPPHSPSPPSFRDGFRGPTHQKSL